VAATLILGRYRYISRLGAGGSSTVLLAEDTLLGRRVALKRVHAADDAVARTRLRREALIGASVSHPNLVSIFDIVTTEDGHDVIVMEYVEGETLAEKLRRGERPTVSEALATLQGVAAALDAIHARGIVHRDVKPANVLLGVDGLVKLADLGIAAVPDGTQITTSETVLGTFRYMAPEQLEGLDATPAIDVYALAAVAFEALSGEKARHEPNPVALAHAIATQPPPDLRAAWPAAPAAAAKVLSRAMSRDPRQRPRSAGELVAQLRAALEPKQAMAVVPRRSRGAFAAVAATALAAVAVALIVLSSVGRSPSRLASSGTRHSVAGATADRSAARAQKQKQKQKPKAKPKSSTPVHSVTPTTPSAPQPSSASPVQVSSAPPPVQSAAGSPVSAVETFYRLAASHQYTAAWALADPSFRAQLEGYQGLEATMAAERAIVFDGASVVNESPSNATVAVRTTSLQTDGTQSCSGTVNLLRAGTGSPGWLLDHIAINCD